MLRTLQKRHHFVQATAKGERCRTHTLLVQCHPIDEALQAAADATALWTGFTATSKLGGAVVRNRAKRRMRALVRAELPAQARPGHYYVFIAREGLLAADHATLQRDLRYALGRLGRKDSHAPDPS